jgi:signal transduction histidine kinase
MTIRDRLSLQYTLVSAVLLLGVLAGIYLLTGQYRRSDFREQLMDRAITHAQLFLAQDNMSTEKFRDVQKKYPLSLSQEIVRIYNDSDKPVFIENGAFQWPRTLIDQVRKQRTVRLQQGDKFTCGIYYADNSGNFTVLASAVDTFGQEEMRQLFWVMFVAFFISIFILFFAGRLFARIALSPMIKVMSDVRFIRSTSLDKRLDTKGGRDEINELAVTFNNLLEHLQQSFEAQSSFVAHASHELKTPVTSIIGDVEVTLSQPREAPEYRQTLEGVLGEAEKLSDLINNLFELAQTNTGFAEFRELRLDELLWQLKDEWATRIPESRIDVQYHLPEDTRKYTIQANTYLLFLAIGNILRNAIKFSDNKVVFCGLYLKNDHPVITIRDTGIGISPEDLRNIFQPFFRGANTFGYAGYGVGLSLADKILRLHNVKVTVHSELNNGTEFLLYFSN